MADPGLLGNIDVAGMAGSAASGLVNILYVVLYALVVGAVIMVIVWYAKHDYTVRVRLQTKMGNLVFNRRGHIVDTGKHKIMKFFLDFKHKVYSVPPKDCIDHMKNGRKIVDVVIDEEGNARYLKVTEINNVLGFMALDTNERAAYIDEIEKSEKRKKRNLLDLIRDLAPLFAVVTIFVLLIVFWGEIAAPFIEVGNAMVGIAEKFDVMVGRLDRVINVLANQQVIDYVNATGNVTGVVPPEAT